MALTPGTALWLKNAFEAAALECGAGSSRGVAEIVVAGVLEATGSVDGDVAALLRAALTMAAADLGGVDELLRGSADGADVEHVRALCGPGPDRGLRGVS